MVQRTSGTRRLDGKLGFISNSANADALAHETARKIAHSLQRAIADRGVAHLCLTGGSTPEKTYRALAGQLVDWPKVHVWFTDERCVPPDDEHSNFRMADNALLSHVAIPVEHVHRMTGESGGERAAVAYDGELHTTFGEQNAPTFDLLLLGVGPDGHVASLFPGAPSLRESGLWATATRAPEGMPVAERVSLTLPVMNRSRTVLFLLQGEGKREVFRRIIVRGEMLPALMVRGLDETSWFVDNAVLPPSLRKS